MAELKNTIMNAPADTLWIYFTSLEALEEWINGVKSTNGPALVSLPSDEERNCRFYMIQGKILGLIVKAEVSKK